MTLMRVAGEITIVDIVWEGPLSLAEVQEKNGPADFGLYQIYGTHGSGSDQLLYIGSASDRRFGTRIPEHNIWMQWEPKEAQIYLGRLGSINAISPTHAAMEEWGKWICWAESVLIHFTSPPFNSVGISSLPKLPDPPIVVLNFKRRHRLSSILSNLYELSPVSEPKSEWQPFVEPDVVSK